MWAKLVTWLSLSMVFVYGNFLFVWMSIMWLVSITGDVQAGSWAHLGTEVSFAGKDHEMDSLCYPKPSLCLPEGWQMCMLNYQIFVFLCSTFPSIFSLFLSPPPHALCLNIADVVISHINIPGEHFSHQRAISHSSSVWNQGWWETEGDSTKIWVPRGLEGDTGMLSPPSPP